MNGRLISFFFSVSLCLLGIAVEGKKAKKVDVESLIKTIGKKIWYLPLEASSQDEVLEDVKELIDGVSEEDIKKIFNTQVEGSKRTLTFQMVLTGWNKLLKFMLDNHGPLLDFTIPEQMGYLPVDAAAFSGAPEVMDLLIEYKRVDPHRKHDDGHTPFHRACWGESPSHTAVAKILVEKAAVDWRETNSEGKTCMEMTENENTKSFLRSLQGGAGGEERETEGDGEGGEENWKGTRVGTVRDEL
uniref:Uncharacterized protein n=1 Tax=Chromera velia CCMP2878 TaxID=1169474 RepID=A0A0G4GPU5_9ALVE|eukprot:Cvel_22851.t1-p1 / transcript=Cvel_22851.t1 / gene=Cvel_22851 / organism=Chromera_velia_CCMP2878 / gene_product=hypothetical protein / transcript_product=hypothetical protein / location=Cvel_scaffold2291:28454-30140(-) / protein_length=243 / sequence_SO=supercontig / SO=protein_coding / is_pseudo=false